MGQTKELGAAANLWGRRMAAKVANYIDAKVLSKTSNEVSYKGERVVIKSAHYKVPQIGLSLAMLKRVSYIIAALEEKSRKFTLYRVEPTWYKSQMVESRSRSVSAPKVKMVTCKAIREACDVIGEMQV